MEVVVIASPLAAAALLIASVRTEFARSLMPATFAVGVASATAAFVGVTRGSALIEVSAVAGTAIAAAGLVLGLFLIDTWLRNAGRGPAPRRWERFERDFWTYLTALDDADDAPGKPRELP